MTTGSGAVTADHYLLPFSLFTRRCEPAIALYAGLGLR